MSRTHQPAQGSLPAIHIVTDNVRIAGVLLEGGFDATPSIKTEALLLWQLGVDQVIWNQLTMAMTIARTYMLFPS